MTPNSIGTRLRRNFVNDFGKYPRTAVGGWFSYSLHERCLRDSDWFSCARPSRREGRAQENHQRGPGRFAL